MGLRDLCVYGSDFRLGDSQKTHERMHAMGLKSVSWLERFVGIQNYRLVRALSVFLRYWEIHPELGRENLRTSSPTVCRGTWGGKHEQKPEVELQKKIRP